MEQENSCEPILDNFPIGQQGKCRARLRYQGMRSEPSQLRVILILALAVLWFSASGLLAPHQSTIPLAQLVRETVQNEIKSSNDHAKFMFRDRKETPKGSQTKLVVETREAMAGMLIAVNDHPLTPEQRRGEEARLERFMNDSAELKKKAKQEKEDAERNKCHCRKGRLKNR